MSSKNEVSSTETSNVVANTTASTADNNTIDDTTETAAIETPPVSLRYRIADWIDGFASQFSLGYLLATTLLAFLGYLVVILFPFLAYKSVDIVFRALLAPATGSSWYLVGGFTLLAGVCSLVTLRIFQTSFVKAPGILIDRDIAPELFKLIDDVRKHYKAPAFKDVIITEALEMRIQELPNFGYPIWPQRHLVIGLPLLQTTAPKHFRSEMARLIAQHSRKGRKTTDWLHRTCNLWNEYHIALNDSRRFGEQPLRWFFQLYAPLMNLLALPAKRMNELAADSAALDFVNGDDLFEAIKYRTVNNLYLRTQFWPRIRKMALHNPHDPLAPTSNLEALAQIAFADIDTRSWLQAAYNTPHSPEDDFPSLRQRMHNIGHSRLRAIPAVRASAAGLYLREARKDLTPAIDKLWRVTTLPQWVQEHKTHRRNVRRIRKLSKKSHYSTLSLKEMLRYASIANQLKQEPRYKSLCKLAKRNLKNYRFLSRLRRSKSDTELNNVF
jgi:hypothetical protein